MFEQAHISTKKRRSLWLFVLKTTQRDSNFGGGLSRYDSDLLLGLMPCAYFLRYRLYGSRRSSPYVLCGYSATIFTFPPNLPLRKGGYKLGERLSNHSSFFVRIKGLALTVAARQYFAVSILLRNFEKQMDNTSASKLPSIIHSLFRPMVVCSPCHCSRSADRSSSPGCATLIVK